ncbi:MAG: TetR/AcrR family transcriptional regulator [Gammaproteobacteria bacterium]
MRKKTAERSQAILDAAKTVFEKVGFDQATMAEIAAEVGYSKATLYNYFRSKEELFLELAHRSGDAHSEQLFMLLMPGCGRGPIDSLPGQVNEILGLLQPSADLPATLQRFGEGVMHNFLTLDALAVRRMIIAAAGTQPEAGRRFYQNGLGKGMQMMAHFFEEAMNSGQLRHAEPRVVAAHFRGLLESEVSDQGLFNARPELTALEITQVVERAVSAFMAAYGPC